MGRENTGWQIDLGNGAECGQRAPSMVEWRGLLKEAIQLLQKRGDGNLHYIDGLEVFGEDMAYNLPDELHPSGDGYELLGLRIASRTFGRNGCLAAGRVSS